MVYKFIVFDLWSSYGHFKKPYTTTSPLTYSIPTRTAIAGIISAIIGLDKEEYNKHFMLNVADIAIAIKNPIKKVRISENLINTKKSIIRIKERTQIKFEYLKDPCYRIFFRHQDKGIHESLKKNLENHESVYTVCMGLSENLANFSLVGEFEAVKKEVHCEEYIEISSVIPVKLLNKGNVDFGCEGEYFTETIPLEMQSNRNVSKYGEVLFERTCRSIRARVKDYIEIPDLNVNICIL